MRPTCFRILAAVLAVVALAAVPGKPPHADAADTGKSQPVVRVAVVNTPHQSGMLASLLPAFEKATGYRVEVYGGNDVYEQAGRGQADLVISHYGKSPVEEFVASGKGLWPHPVFSNQSVLVGPKDDPAKIRGMTDPFEAMKRIAASGAPFVATANPVGRYLSEMLMAGAGNPPRGTWYIETAESRGRGMQLAAEKGAYTIWGSFPFERFRGKHDTGLEVMVWNTPVFLRVMAAIVVNPDKVPGVNVEGAKALRAYLLSPVTQAAIARFRDEGLDRQTWWPAAHFNDAGQILGMRGEDADD